MNVREKEIKTLIQEIVLNLNQLYDVNLDGLDHESFAYIGGITKALKVNSNLLADAIIFLNKNKMEKE